MSGLGAYGETAFGADAAVPDDGIDRVEESLALAAAAAGVPINVLVDSLHATGSPYAFAQKFESLNDEVAWSERMAVVWRLLAAEGIDLTGTALGNLRKLAVAIDAIHAAGVVGTRLEAKVEIAQVLTISTLLRSGWKVEASDSTAFQDALTATLRMLGTALDTLGFNDIAGAGVRFLAVAGEGVEFAADLTAMRQLFERLRDDVLLYTTLRLADGSEWVGWVLNEGAPSEYINFPMNGLAAFDKRYFGTSTDGFYLLEGEDDEGEQIDASFLTAFTDFGTGQLKGQVEAYVALSTDGTQLVFKVLNVDKRGDLIESIYTQPVTAGALHNEKMKIGKGLEGTYWQFGLENVEGADFEIDSLDFRPLILTRRI